MSLQVTATGGLRLDEVTGIGRGEAGAAGRRGLLEGDVGATRRLGRQGREPIGSASVCARAGGMRAGERVPRGGAQTAGRAEPRDEPEGA